MDIDVEAIYRKYGPMVLRRCKFLLKNEQKALDAMQDTFVKLLRYQHKLHSKALSSLLYRIATNEALMFLRRQKPVMLSVDATMEGGEGEIEPVQIVDWSSLPEDELMSSEARVYLDKAVESLTPSLRVVFVLRDVTLEREC